MWRLWSWGTMVSPPPKYILHRVSSHMPPENLYIFYIMSPKNRNICLISIEGWDRTITICNYAYWPDYKSTVMLTGSEIDHSSYLFKLWSLQIDRVCLPSQLLLLFWFNRSAVSCKNLLRALPASLWPLIFWLIVGSATSESPFINFLQVKCW